MFKKDQIVETQKNTSERNIIGKTTQITGEINSEGSFRIDGTLKGSIKTSGRVVIGTTGFVNGNIDCLNAEIEGKFVGKLNVSKTLTIKSTANISGEVIIDKLSVEPGAVFNATCTMKGAVKALKNDQQTQSAEEATA